MSKDATSYRQKAQPKMRLGDNQKVAIIIIDLISLAFFCLCMQMVLDLNHEAQVKIHKAGIMQGLGGEQVSVLDVFPN